MTDEEAFDCLHEIFPLLGHEPQLQRYFYGLNALCFDRDEFFRALCLILAIHVRDKAGLGEPDNVEGG